MAVSSSYLVRSLCGEIIYGYGYCEVFYVGRYLMKYTNRLMYFWSVICALVVVCICVVIPVVTRFIIANNATNHMQAGINQIIGQLPESDRIPVPRVGLHVLQSSMLIALVAIVIVGMIYVAILMRRYAVEKALSVIALKLVQGYTFELHGVTTAEFDIHTLRNAVKKNAYMVDEENMKVIVTYGK